MLSEATENLFPGGIADGRCDVALSALKPHAAHDHLPTPRRPPARRAAAVAAAARRREHPAAAGIMYRLSFAGDDRYNAA